MAKSAAFTAPIVSKYVPWFKLAREVLGDLILEMSDEELSTWVSKADWLMFPLVHESERSEAVNRPDPKIYIALTTDSLRLGLVCNTIRSVEKMRNILDSYHSREKIELLKEMQKLDNNFETSVLSKVKDHNFAQRL